MSTEIKISRRDFLKGALALAGGAALSACGLPEKKSQVVTQEPSLPTPKPETPPVTNTPEVVEKSPSPTATEVSQEEILRQWQERMFTFGVGSSVGGPELLHLMEFLEKRGPEFLKNIALTAHEMGLPVEKSSLMIGISSPFVEDEKGHPIHPEQKDPSRLIALLVTEQNQKNNVICFLENEGGGGISWQGACDWYTPDKNIWGTDFKMVVPEDSQGRPLFDILIGEVDGEKVAYSTKPGVLGQTERFIPVEFLVREIKEGNESRWVLTDEKAPIGEKQELSGVLLVAGRSQEKIEDIGCFVLRAKSPFLPEGKERLKDDKETFLDLIPGKIHVWESRKVEGEDAFEMHYCGYWNLKEEKWSGVDKWQQYESLFEDKVEPTPEPTTTPTPEPTPTPLMSPEEEQLYADITRVFATEKSPEVPLILEELERAKTIDPKKSEMATGQHYGCYTSAASFMIAIYYASGDSPQKRNPEMLKLLAQVREMARQSSRFDEKDWVFEAVDSY